MFTVYKITNKCNGHFYIGMTSLTLKQRWQRHNNSGSDRMPIYRAIKKYGRDHFEVESMFLFDAKNKASQKEIELIENLKPEYNIGLGGEGVALFGEKNGMFGKTQTDEWKRNKSINMMGANNYMFGRHRTQEEIQRISNTRKQLFADGKLVNYWKDRPKHPTWTTKGMIRTEEMNMKLRKKFLVIDGDHILEVHNAKQFCLERGYNYGCFTQACKHQKTYRGLTITYLKVNL